MDDNHHRQHSTDSTDSDHNDDEYETPEEGMGELDDGSGEYFDAEGVSMYELEIGVKEERINNTDELHVRQATQKTDEKKTVQGTFQEDSNSEDLIRVLDSLKPVDIEPPAINATRNAYYQNDGWICLTFHALIAPNIKFNSDTDHVYIYFWSEPGYFLNVVETQFVCYRSDANNAAEVVGSANFKMQSYYGVVTYKYHVDRKGKTSKGKLRKLIEEEVYKKGRQGRRPLYFEYKKNNIKGSFSQYDGFVYRPNPRSKDTSWSTFGTIFSGLFHGKSKDEDAEIVSKVFGRNIVTVLAFQGLNSKAIADAVSNTNSLIQCVERNYDARDRRLIHTTLKNIFTYVLQLYADSRDASSGQRKLAISIFLLKRRYIFWNSTAEPPCALLCKSFLPAIDPKQDIPSEWECLSHQNLDAVDRLELKTKLVQLAKDICRGTGNEKDPKWMYLVPILHLLEGTCKPNEQFSLNCNHSATVPTWWGLSESLEQIVNLFKQRVATHWTKPLTAVIGDLQGLFKMDLYLPRTIMACLLFQETKDAIDTHLFPPEVCCASIAYHLKFRFRNEEQLDKCLESLLAQIEDSHMEMEHRPILVGMQIAIDMLYEALKRQHLGIVSKSIRIMLWLLAVNDKLLEGCEMPKELDESKLNLQKISNKICEWVNRNKNMIKTVTEYIKTWDNFFAPSNIPNTRQTRRWMEVMTNLFTRQIQHNLEVKKLTFPKALVQTYCSGLEGCSQVLRDVLTPIVCNALTDAKTITSKGMSDQEFEALRNVMAMAFVKECEMITQTHGNFGLSTILGWSSLPMFLKVLYTEKDIGKLNKQCQDQIQQIETSVDLYIRILQSGNIKVTELRLLHDNSGFFVSLTELMQKEKTVKETLETKMLELRSFQEMMSALRTLKTICDGMEDVTVDTRPLDEILEKDLDSCSLNDLVVVSDCSVDPQASQVCRLVSEKLTEPVMKMLSQIGNFEDSVCFRNQWKEETQKLTTGCTLSIDDLLCTIYEPVIESLHNFENGVSKGTITFNEMELYIGQYYEENLEQMVSELSKVCSSTNVKMVRRRVDQYKQGRDVIARAETAREMMDIQTIYGLTGEFRPVEKICTFDIRSVPLSSDKGDIIKASKALGSFSKKALSCLKTFSKCYELVNWLRESMTHDGLRELKVFVDLAMMSAGDSTEKVSRVQSLHAGVSGYSSLIFDLQQQSSYEQFLKKCEPVLLELESTPLLPEKLEHANRFLHWFKEIKQAHGAVEVTSFVQAQVINERGIYKIGTNIWEKPEDTNLNMFHSTIAELTDIKQILKLTVLVDKEHEVPKEYTYDKLQDLQSRLMLVAGEAENSKKDVERFSLVLDGVVRLCNIYMKLVKSGCMLFQDFAIKLYCDTNPDRPVCAILEFENENIQLKCRKTKDEQLEDVMHKIASAMDIYLNEWLDYVDWNRKKYPELNYFTIEQLVILKREIAKLNDDKEPTHLMYPILHVAKRDCKPEDVKKAHQLATQELETHIENGMNGEVAEVEEKEISSNETVFIQTLIDAGYGRLIPFALQEFPDLNASEALCWCMENEENVDQMEASQKKTTIEEVEADTYAADSKTDLVSIDTLILRAIDDTSQFDRCEAMLSKLNEIWKDFLKSISTNMKGLISLNHLGSLLRHLSCNDKSTLRRSLPTGFSDCSPNLIVCQKDDILYQTLSLYLTEDDQPLPQSDEILTCSAETTFEQVDIFLRRAFFNPEGKIHCLMNADLMDLSVCEVVEQRIHQFARVSGTKVKYRLVIICDSESENKSVIISSLDKYRKTTTLTNEDKLCSLVCSKLQMTENQESAAVVDIERSTVRVITSTRSGAGKTLFKIRRDEQLQKLTKSLGSKSISLPLQEKCINLNYVTGNLLLYVEGPFNTEVRIFHIDITNEVKIGIDYFLFNFLILGCLVDKSGYVWRKLPTDLYLLETMALDSARECQILQLLPQVMCRTPCECLDIYRGNKLEGFSDSDQLFDEEEYNSDMYQKPYICLKSIDGTTAVGSSKRHCIETLMKHCGVSNPSWSEIHHFVKFLYRQLLDFEKNVFFSKAAQEILPGFSMFVQRFLIPMSRDFSSRSLNISEESDEHRQDVDTKELQKYKMKRTWESSPHPYLFFNEDGHTFTFLGFNITKSFDLVDVKTKAVLERAIMSSDLYQALIANKVQIQEDFDKLQRNQKIQRLCKVMGADEHNETVYDKTYELTTDNCKKMMAVYMRFRCGIPVIVMGETGCGKTRLVKFLCELMVPRDETTCKPKTKNMIIMKVHGGVTNEDIKSKVKEAEKSAIENKKINENMYTILFFDEANTTESIGLIKEIICDQTMEGRPLDICKNLKFVAACNPYRKHPDDLIKKLDKAGLGYHVSSTRTKDTFGKLPMRHLVYRVQPLPQSLMAFVWDFGQLDSFVENLYIRQMIRRYMTDGDRSSSIARNHERLRYDESLLDVISSILTASQDYMRSLKDECSFVSLRDVERTLQVMCWFYSRSKDNRTVFTLADKKMKERKSKNASKLNDETRSLILALGVCYHASLTNRVAYRGHISKYFKAPCELQGGPNCILEEIDCFEEVFLDSLELEENIARNQALKENVFMMIVCIELRIPLFLVGKPGSSKSLAKIIVTDAMQGRAAKSTLFKELKQVQMISFQCSPHSTAAGIVSTFRQCANLQENYQQNLDKFVSVVVLDEIGLAEDSPKMPLKTLHPLLEDGCQGDETPQEYMKVAFIGLSNWSLDPGKMNRGLFVQREVPDAKELETTAKGICSSTKYMNTNLIKPLATAYLKVFNKASEEKREFFGLRDFYSFMKMINVFVKTSKEQKSPTYHKLRFAVRRNFSGIETFDTFNIFLQEVKYIDQSKRKKKPGDPDDSFSGLIKSWLQPDSESRHLLLLTENNSALSMFQQEFLTKESRKPIIIFGSSFRRDQEYTQVCRNINRIKLCMETGNLVILANSDNLYESLYDALNQYYVYFGGERYVDLGLGTHRVKCPVHLDFKLIVVAEKETVYKKFPIPLINRLEKHCLSSSTLLSEGQNYLAAELKTWVEKITEESLSLGGKSVTDDDVKKIFIGYHQDACSAVAHYMMRDENAFGNEDMFDEVFSESKEVLLWCATPDAIVRLTSDKETIQNVYLNKQAHDSISDYLQFHFKTNECNRIYAQITTHSTLLTMSHKPALGQATGIPADRIFLLEALSSYDTEQQFNSKIKEHVRNCGTKPSLLVIQCHSGDMYVNLIACAKYSVLHECASYSAVSLLFIIQLTPMETKNFQSLQCGEWHSAHIDNLYSSMVDMPRLLSMEGTPLSSILKAALDNTEVVVDRNIDGEEVNQLNKNQQETSLDLKGLIYRCVQRAMSLIRDTVDDAYRSTRRISWVFSILHDNKETDSASFVKGVAVFVKNIQAIRESFAAREDEWLAKEAASSASIQKFGTLRRACLQAIESKISPILSGIFAELDTNQNLSVLDKESDSWQRILWLSLLNTHEVREHMKSVKCGNTENVVISRGFGGSTFQNRMPFSWIILQTFEHLVKQQTIMFDENDEEGLKPIVGLLEGTGLRKSLDSVAKENFYEALEAYIFDFTETFYPEEKDRNLVSLYLKHYALSTATRDQNTSLTYTLFCVHRVFEGSSTCLKYFRDISSVWEGCNDTLMKRKGADLLEEHDLALLALYFLVDSVSPESKQLEETFDYQVGREKWLARVNRYRQVVNQTFAFYQNLGDQSERLGKAKNMWNRVVVMQLFIEGVCLKSEDPSSTFRCRPLWMQLSTTPEVNMKHIDTLKKVEKFLQMCLTRMKNESAKKAEKCKKCGGTHTEESKTLACTHEICKHCIEEVLSESVSAQKCPVCNNKLEAGWDTKHDDEETVKRWIADKVGDYRQRCNSFLMEVVSQLCFADNTPPDSEVVDWLISCSFQNVTKLMADIGVEQNEVFKSFIFKHLVRTDENELRAHLKKYIQIPVEEHEDDSEVLSVNVILTVIHSFEDKISEGMTLRNANERAIVERCFNLALVHLESKESVVDQIFAIARARVGLSFVAKCIDKMLFHEDSITANCQKDMEELLQLAKELCEDREWPWRYLLLYIAREYGVNVLLSACKSKNVNINWIQKTALQEKVKETVDIYTACGEKYIILKELVLATLVSKDGNILVDHIKKSTNKRHLAVMFELTVHREIESQRAIKGKDRTEQQIAVVKQAFLALKSPAENPNANCLALDQTVMKQMQLEVCPQNDNDRDINIKCLIFHWLCVIRHLESNCCTVLKALFQIAVEPGAAKNFYLPCMPHDILAGLRETLLATAKDKYSGQNTVYFQCENGHPYEVGNCGRPVATGAKCFCGSPIGGTSYNVLHEKNRPVDNADRTKPGHCLGFPKDRDHGAIPERSLSPIQCALLKFLLHITMYLGCGKSKKDICALITPEIEDELVYRFLWDHILLDIQDLQHAFTLNADEVLLLSHCWVDAIMEKGLHKEETIGAAADMQYTLLTKEGRDKWEVQFADLFFGHIADTEGRTQMLIQASELLKNSNSLLAMLNECPDDNQDQALGDIKNLDKNPSVWKYRTPATLTRLGQAFQRKLSEDTKREKSYSMLEMFLNKQAEIQTVRFIPSILQLHKALLRRYSRKIFKSEAVKITVAHLKKDKVAGEETEALLEDLVEAWNVARKVLSNSIVRTDKGSRLVNQELSTDVSAVDITDDTALIYLLPTMEGKGICTYSLLDQLIQCHNDVIERYKYSDRGQRDTGFSTVQPMDITSAHVISYHPQDDLLPIVLANCSVSTMHSTEVEYDFEKIEKGIVERFISTKSRVHKRNYLQIELMTYRSSLTSASKLDNLGKKIIQVTFETVLKTTLCNEIRDIPVISQILSKLDIAINFLDITGGDQEDSLHEFMTDRLKMNKNVLTTKMQQTCSLKHVRALWLALSLHRSNIMVQQNKPTEMIFENIEPEYHAQVPAEIKQTYQRYLQVLPKERLFHILEVVYEFITVVLTEAENKEDEDYVDRGHFSLDDCLGVFSEEDINVPEDILCIHSLHFWVEVSRMYDIRIKERATVV